jgi:hypothetical protein
MPEEVLPPGWTRIEPPRSTSGQSIALDDGRLLRIAERPQVFDPAHDRWTDTGSMIERGLRRRALAITPEGWALACGGDLENEPTDVCELYDPARNTWLAMPPLPDRRYDHVAITARGRVMVIGGKTKDSWGARVDTTAVWSWAPGDVWHLMPALPLQIESPRALVLDDESIVVWGNAKESACWDHTQWTTMPAIRSSSAVAATPDGLVSAGGNQGDEAIADVRTWSATHGWQAQAALPKPRKRGRGLQLADKRVAIVGGTWTEKSWEDTSSGGELDIEYRSFMAWVVNDYYFREVLVQEGAAWRSMPAPLLYGTSAHALPDGRVIVDDAFLWTP